MAAAVNGWIVVTGASTGIGRASSLRLAQRGYSVLAGIRNAAVLEAIRKDSPANLHPIWLDVTRPESIADAKAAVGAAPLAGLINNAGVAMMGPVELVAIDEWREQFEVNVIGLVRVTQAFLPALRLAKGRVVNIGSIAGRSPLPGSGPYDASKFAIEAITDSLRMELRASGVSVSLIEPGAVATPLWQKALANAKSLRSRAEPNTYERYARLMANLEREAMQSLRKAMPVERIARVVERAMTARRPKARYVIGADARMWLSLNLLPDRLRDRLILSELQK